MYSKQEQANAAAGVFDRPDWWEANGAFALLHSINPLRLKYVERMAGGLQGKRLCDLGCGGGIFAQAAAAAGAQVVAADSSAVAINAAKARAKQDGVAVDYRLVEGERPAANLPAGGFDVVCCLEVLEHVERPANMAADSAALLAPGGVAVFSTINRTARAWALMLAGLEVALRVLPLGTHDYAKFITPPELARMCKDAGLQVEDVTGLRYSFFGKTYLLDQSALAVNYFMTARRPKQ